MHSDLYTLLAVECGEALFAAVPAERNREACYSDPTTVDSSSAGSSRTLTSSSSCASPTLASSFAVPVLHCDRSVSQQSPSTSLLHPNNDAVWIAVLCALRRRGALGPRECAGAQRLLSPFTFQPIMPWLWSGLSGSHAHPALPLTIENDVRSTRHVVPSATDPHSGKVSEPGVMEEESTPMTDGRFTVDDLYADIHRSVMAAAQEEAISHSHGRLMPSVDALRTAPPTAWRAIARRVVQLTEENDKLDVVNVQDKIGTSNPRWLITWQEVLLSISEASAFALGQRELLDAHTVLLEVVADFYADATARAAAIPTSPIPLDDKLASLFRDQREENNAKQEVDSERVATLSVLPPALLHRLQELYSHQHALMAFAALYERCVEGEEAVVQQARLHDTDTAARSVVTQLLLNGELLSQYLAIPGRRGVALPWEEQWSHTLRHAAFGFRRLFRWHIALLQRKLGASSSPSSGLPTSPLLTNEVAQELVWQWRKSFTTLFNVCVWVKNNNEEGVRCQAALRTVLGAFVEVCPSSLSVASPHCLPPAARAALSWEVVRALRQVSVDCMLQKTRRLKYACSPGLLDVCTLAAVLEALRPSTPHTTAAVPTDGSDDSVDATVALSVDSIPMLLHESKPTAKEVWCALLPHPSARKLSRYALLTVGGQLARCVTDAAASEVIGTAHRLLKEVRLWAALMGQPLRLWRGEAESMWRLRVTEGNESCGTVFDVLTAARHPCDGGEHTARWQSSASTPKEHRYTFYGSATRAPTWTCGCGYDQNPCTSLHCVACVCRSLQPAQWECPHCHSTPPAGDGDVHATCVQCGALHPALHSCMTTETNTAGDRAAQVMQSVGSLPLLRCAEHRPLPCGHHSAYVCGGDADESQRRSPQLCCCTMCGELSQQVVPSSVVQPTPLTQAHGVDSCVLPASPRPPLCFHCEDCDRYTITATAPTTSSSSTSTATDTASDASVTHRARQTRCACCGGTRGYHLGYFTWQCGCGALNSPSHTFCWACSTHHHDGVTDELSAAEAEEAALSPAAFLHRRGVKPVALVSDESAPTAAVSHAVSQYECTECHAMISCSDDVDPFAASLPRCPHCHACHPCHRAATKESRLLACPTCAQYIQITSGAFHVEETLSDANHVADAAVWGARESGLPPLPTRCPHCHSALAAVLQAHLHTQADQPWHCFHCGNANAVREVDGTLRASRVVQSGGSKPARNSDAEPTCEACGTPRVPVAYWEFGRPWTCVQCGYEANHRYSCERCHALPRGVPVSSVDLWQCTSCESAKANYTNRSGTTGPVGTLNPSWHAHCSRAGCCAPQPEAALPHRLSYRPWQCVQCTQWSRSEDLPTCERCGAPHVKELDGSRNVNKSVLGSPSQATHTEPIATLAEKNETANKSSATATSTRQDSSSSNTALVRRLEEVEAVLLHAATASWATHGSHSHNHNSSYFGGDGRVASPATTTTPPQSSLADHKMSNESILKKSEGVELIDDALNTITSDASDDGSTSAAASQEEHMDNDEHEGDRSADGTAQHVLKPSAEKAPPPPPQSVFTPTEQTPSLTAFALSSVTAVPNRSVLTEGPPLTVVPPMSPWEEAYLRHTTTSF